MRTQRRNHRRSPGGPTDVTSFLDTQERIVGEREACSVQIPFAEENLQGLELKMGGGLLGGRLYILGGIPWAGKTLVVNNMADNICLAGYPVLFFSYDDGRDELRKRTLARFRAGFTLTSSTVTESRRGSSPGYARAAKFLKFSAVSLWWKNPSCSIAGMGSSTRSSSAKRKPRSS